MTISHWAMLLALALAEAVTATGSVAVIAGLHAWQGQFGNSASIGWILSSYMLVSAAGAAVFGRLGDMFGRRRMLLVVLCLFVLGSVVSLVAGQLGTIIFGRVIQGAAGAILSLLLGIIREEILAVIAKHVNLDPDKVQVKLERGNTFATLEVDIEVPNRFGMALAKSA